MEQNYLIIHPGSKGFNNTHQLMIKKAFMETRRGSLTMLSICPLLTGHLAGRQCAGSPWWGQTPSPTPPLNEPNKRHKSQSTYVWTLNGKNYWITGSTEVSAMKQECHHEVDGRNAKPQKELVKILTGYEWHLYSHYRLFQNTNWILKESR